MEMFEGVKKMLEWRVMKYFENFGAQRPENLEGETKSVISWFAKNNPALIPAALAAAISVGEVKAESIEEIHGQNWLEGVETLRESVMSAETEVGATFVIGEDGTQHWYSSGKGEVASVNKNMSDIQQELDQFTEVNDEAVERFCEVHTHNLAAMAEVDYISDAELTQFRADGYGPSAPPSLDDISLVTEAKIQSAVGDASYFKTVFDAQGVWYSRVPTDADYDAFPNIRAEIEHKKEVQESVFGDPSDLSGGIVIEAMEAMDEETLQALVEEYGSEQDREGIAFAKEYSPEQVRPRLVSALWLNLIVNRDPDYPLISDILSKETDRELYQTYLEAYSSDDDQFYRDTKASWVEASKDGQFDESMLPQMYEALIRQGALVRFVPYDQVPNEPPCAGPDYKPE